ncbi:MAG TPA: signal peptide peptidase SppA [Anaerolineales bacterium]|nr:signal peptide peptidase SppA [Anaerolineales bacterium]
MMPDTPSTTTPPAPRVADTGSTATRVFAQTLLSVLAGFTLPVLACYGLIIVSVLALQILSWGAASGPTSSRGPTTGPAVAIIHVEGVITSGSGTPFDTGGIAFSNDVIENVRKANEDAEVKAIVLAVNSPGGGVVASDEIYHALSEVEKPIVVVVGDLGASGGYYISMASDWIVANPNSLVGSIGVISEFPNAEGLLEKVGVDFVVITSGERKDIGSPYREMTDAEREYWQTIIDETYEGFVEIVAQGRELTVDEVKPLADGGVFTGRQALELKLIDQLGYEEDAITKAAELGGITGEPRIVEYNREPTFFELLFGLASRPSLLPSLAEIMNLVGHPSLSARWVGQ